MPQNATVAKDLLRCWLLKIWCGRTLGQIWVGHGPESRPQIAPATEESRQVRPVVNQLFENVSKDGWMRP